MNPTSKNLTNLGMFWRQLGYWMSMAVPTALGVAIGAIDFTLANVVSTFVNVIAGIFGKKGIGWSIPHIMRKSSLIDGHYLEASFLYFEGRFISSVIRHLRCADAFTMLGTALVIFGPRQLSGQTLRHESIHVVQGQRYSWKSFYYGVKYGDALEIEAYLGAKQYTHPFLQRIDIGARPKFIPDTYWNEKSVREAEKAFFLVYPKNTRFSR